MSDEEIISNWYADVYDQTETQSYDVDLMLKILSEGGVNKQVLEVACGSGRLLVPLAKAGFNATGIDFSDGMLARIGPKAKDLTNISWRKCDAVHESWGSNFDVVILAGNLMINIESDMNQKEAQKLFITKAYNSLKPGGHVYLDFDCPEDPFKYFYNSDISVKTRTSVRHAGTDRMGNSGEYKTIKAHTMQTPALAIKQEF
ncbi:MAG: methyltransferase domain-containing protein [Firmicutes bacterium]|nr:methyltransferase domain-containing protein [Bacillota bacterium]